MVMKSLVSGKWENLVHGYDSQILAGVGRESRAGELQTQLNRFKLVLLSCYYA